MLENINYVCIENPPFNYGKMQTRIKYEDDLCVVVAASPRREHNSKTQWRINNNFSFTPPDSSIY